MKYSYLMIAALVVFTSCSKKDTENDVAAQEVNNQIEKLKDVSDFQSGVQIYNLMSAGSKYKMWNDHLVKARAQFASSGDSKRNELVGQLLSNMSANVFDKNTAASDVFQNYFMPTWLKMAKITFSDNELYDLVFDPNAEPIGTLVAPPDIGNGGEEIPASCFCHAGESGFSCRKITINFPTGITIVNGVCENTANCTSSSSGCGWFWLTSCNGNHCNF